MPCLPGGTPVPSEVRLAAVVVGNPAVQRPSGEARQERRLVAVRTQQLPAQAVDEQDDNAFGRLDGQHIGLAGNTQRGQRGRQHVGREDSPYRTAPVADDAMVTWPTLELSETATSLRLRP